MCTELAMVSTQEALSLLLERDVQESEREFLEDSAIEDNLQTAVEEFEGEQDIEFESSLEFVLTTTHERNIELSDDDVVEYIQRGKCGCKKATNGQPCSSSFSSQDIIAHRLDMSELDHTELDLVIMAQLQSGMHSDKLLTNTRGAARPEVCQRITYSFSFKGQSICRETFLFLHTISKERLYRLAHHLTSHGVVPRVHGNKQRKPKHACTFVEINHVVNFIKHYADAHAVPLPGRLPKHQDYRVMKLPSDVTKASVHRE